MKAGINVRYLALLAGIQGHENANREGLLFPQGRCAAEGQRGKKETMAKELKPLQAV